MSTIDPKKSFLRLQPIVDIVEASIWSGRVKDEKPVSIMLVAPQESAKTEILKHFFGTATLEYSSDLTSKGMSRYKKDIESLRKRHIVIMDLIRVVNHGKGVSNRTIQVLSTLTEEGETSSSDAGGYDSWSGFPVIGLLSAITPQYWKRQKGGWRASGFLTRFLPVHFSYTQQTISAVHKAIAYGHKLPDPRPAKLPEQPCKVILPEQYAEWLISLAENLGKVNEVFGYRFHRALRRLAMGRALSRGRMKVAHEDIAAVRDWSKFFSGETILL